MKAIILNVVDWVNYGYCLTVGEVVDTEIFPGDVGHGVSAIQVKPQSDAQAESDNEGNDRDDDKAFYGKGYSHCFHFSSWVMAFMAKIPLKILSFITTQASIQAWQKLQEL